jgi:hypothetical protein
MAGRAKITVTWDGDIIERVDAKLSALNGRVYDILDGLGAEGAGFARSISPVETGNYRGSLHARRRLTRNRQGVEITSAAPHAHLVEVGRKPGKAPPSDKLGPVLGLTGADAFMVARSIAAKGTKGHRVIAKTKKAMAPRTVAAHRQLGIWLNDLDAS